MCFSLYFSPARDALAGLLREHGEDEPAECLLRDELVDLNLGDCPIGDDGAEIVSDFLKHDETVKKVWLYHCKIGPRGAKAIADAMKHNQTVEFLYFFVNQIGEEGVAAFIDALNYNVCTKKFMIDTNEIAPELKATLEYLPRTRNKILIPAAVRRASLSLIAARRNIADAGNLAIFPKEIVKMIAMEVYATRKEPIWIEAVSGPEFVAQQRDYVEKGKREYEEIRAMYSGSNSDYL